MRRGPYVILSSGFMALAILLICGSSAAQIMFERTYGESLYEEARSVQQTQDGGYIVAGMTDSYGAGGLDWYLVRTDSMGEPLWSRTYGLNGTDWCHSVLETSNGNFVASGSMNPYHGSHSFWLLQMDSSGDTVWAKNPRGLFYGFYCVVRQTSDRGHITVIHADTSDPPANRRICLVKTDSTGELVWEEMYEDSGRGNDVAQTLDGGYIVVGTRTISSDRDIYLMKTDASGQMVWSKIYGGPGTDGAVSVIQTPDGGYLVAGYTSSFGAGEADVYLIRTDSLGDSLWTRTYGGPLNDAGLSLDRASDGGYVIAGETKSYGAGSSDVLLMKIDSTGDMIWMRTYGGSELDYGHSVQQTQDGGYIIAGYTYSYGAGGSDVYLIKTDENGLTGVQEDRSEFNVQRSTYVVLENRPNPFSSSTVISYFLPLVTEVTLEVYDITGRLVETLVDERQKPGVREVHWDRKGNPSGVFFCRLKAGDFVETKKMVVVD